MLTNNSPQSMGNVPVAGLDSESNVLPAATPPPNLWRQASLASSHAHLSCHVKVPHVVFVQSSPNNGSLYQLTGEVEMPKLLFSKIRSYEFKDFIQNVKQPRRMDILLSHRKRRRDMQCVVVRDTQVTASLSKCSSREDNHSSLKKMLRDQKHLAAFRGFLRSEFSEENVDFWLACEAFRLTASPAERRWEAERIYQEFLHPNAPREVNVDHMTRERLRGSLAEPRPPPWCFDEAQRNIYLLMESDTWPRFLRSGACHGLGHKTSTVWYI